MNKTTTIKPPTDSTYNKYYDIEHPDFDPDAVIELSEEEILENAQINEWLKKSDKLVAIEAEQYENERRMDEEKQLANEEAYNQKVLRLDEFLAEHTYPVRDADDEIIDLERVQWRKANSWWIDKRKRDRGEI